jgi:hypothetical protein
MAGIYGIDPFFTYTYEDPSYNVAKDCLQYHPESLMSYLVEFHPKFTKIVENTKYYSGIFSDLQYRGTLFLPKEESIAESLLENMDINFCRRFVDYHSMDGFFPKTVLMTSPYQQLQTRIKGQYITASMYKIPSLNNEISLVLNDYAYIELFDKRIKNAFVHILSSPLPLNFFA